MPVPVMELSPAALAQWSAMVASAYPAGNAALLVESGAPGGVAGPPPRNTDGRAALTNFLHTASPEALRLAVLAATSDSTTLAVLRAIQEELLPGSGVGDLAEVLVSGIFQHVPESNEPDLRIRMNPECRAGLQALASTQDRWDVYRAVTATIRRTSPESAGRFQAVVHDPRGNITVREDQQAFAEMARSALAQAANTLTDLNASLSADVQSWGDDSSARQQRKAGERERLANEAAARDEKRLARGAGVAVAGVSVAKRHGLWAEIQRQQRIRQREFREFQRDQAQMVREAAKAERDGKRQAAASERERKKLYIEDRKAEAAAMAADVRARLAELDGLLEGGIRDRPVVTFASLRRTDTYPPFDPGQLGEPLPAPAWEDFAPAPPSGIGKILGGTGRFERQLDSARTAYAQAAEQHTAAEAGGSGNWQLSAPPTTRPPPRSPSPPPSTMPASTSSSETAGPETPKLSQSSAPSSWTHRCTRRDSRTTHALCTGQIRKKPSSSGNCHHSR